MDRLNKLDVYYHDRHVGTMALFRNRLAAFEYSTDLSTGQLLRSGTVSLKCCGITSE